MKIYRYWAKGAGAQELQARNPATGEQMESFSCWGWSEISQQEAEERARQRTKAIAETIRAGKRPDSYLYGDRPMREEIIEEWKRADSTTYAVVTLNAYGCQVLNTESIMFVDVDLPAVSAWKAFQYGLRRMIKKHTASPREEQEAHALGKVQNMVQADSRCGVRVYRTFAGLRYLLTHSHADPVAETTLAAMEALGADPLYLRLCKIQACFRARLTPKPWRCGAHALRVRYPWSDPGMERQARDWIAGYSKKAEAYATCALLRQFGTDSMDEEIRRVVEYHDSMTKAQSGLNLA